MKRIWIILVFSLLQYALYADYLEVRRNTGIKAQPESAAQVIYQSTARELFYLLDEGHQTNGYYQIAIPGGKTGWVYRTLVRLHRGDLPTDPSALPQPAAVFGEGQIPPGYYAGTENLTGEALKRQLHRIIRNHKVFTYSNTWTILAETDRDPVNPANVILLYTARSYNAAHRDRGTSFNYEA